MSSSVKKLNFEDKSSWYNTILEHPVFNSSTNGGGRLLICMNSLKWIYFEIGNLEFWCVLCWAANFLKDEV